MADVWVVNASPIIALGKIGRLRLLSDLNARVIVPPVVRAEVLRVEVQLIDTSSGWKVARVDILQSPSGSPLGG